MNNPTKITRKLKFQTTVITAKTMNFFCWLITGRSWWVGQNPTQIAPIRRAQSIHKPRPCRHTRRRALAPINGITNQAEPPMLTRRHSLLVGRPTRIGRDVDSFIPPSLKTLILAASRDLICLCNRIWSYN